MGKEKYYANYLSGRSTLLTDIFGTNKKELSKRISLIARSVCSVGFYYDWYVWNSSGIVVACGRGKKNSKGNICYYRNSSLGLYNSYKNRNYEH